MVSVTEKIQSGFELARRLHEALWMRAVDPQYLSVDELRDVISEMFDVDIKLKTLDVEASTVLGFIERWEGGRKACVYIVKNIGIRWKRLVAVKELCHVGIDIEEDWNPDGLDTLQRLMTNPPDIDAVENLAFRSEHIAEMVGIELLYPFENRRGDIEALQRGETRTDILAARYRLPEGVIQMVLSPVYMAMCGKYWAAVHSAHQAEVMRSKLGVVPGGREG